MRSVRFTKGSDVGFSHYTAGEVACFPVDVAEKLITSGRAVDPDGANASEAALKADSVPPPSSSSATGAASTQSLFPPETPPSPATEAADIRAANLSRPQREGRRNRGR